MSLVFRSRKTYRFTPRLPVPATRKAASITWNRPFEQRVLVEQLAEMGHQGFPQRFSSGKSRTRSIRNWSVPFFHSSVRCRTSSFCLRSSDLFQKGADDAVGGLVFEVFGLSFRKRFGKTPQEKLRGLRGIPAF